MTSSVVYKLVTPGGSRRESCEASGQLLDFLKYVFRYLIATRDSELGWITSLPRFLPGSSWIEEPQIHEK